MASVAPVTRWLSALLVAGVIWPANPAYAVIKNVNEASDVCSATANPCSITQAVETVPGAVLDFGLREVRITGSGGMIDAGTGSVTIRCGKLVAQKSGTAIQVKGASGTGTTVGGFARFIARRGCSANRSLPCVRDSECVAASAGTCSFGSGDILIGGKVLGSADLPGGVLFMAAGDIQVSSTITINGTALDSDAGAVELDAQGDIDVDDRIQASGGGQGSGGEVCLTAGGDIRVTDLLDVTGGDFDGGVVEMLAGGSVTVTEDIKGNSTSGEGFGGEFTLESGGDMTILGGTNLNRLLLSTDGHQSAENFGGDGGTQDFVAGGDLRIGRFVRITSDGAPPDGFGEAITIEADGDVLIEGELHAKGDGGQSGGGELDVSVEGILEISPTATLDVSGADGGGGEVLLFADDGIVMGGKIVATGSAQGGAGIVDIDSQGTLTIGGEIEIDGLSGGIATLSGCDVRLVAGSRIDNKPPGGFNHFVAREKFTASSGSDARVGAGGSNLILYRTNSKPPVVAGAMSPAPRLERSAELFPCPVCGNSLVEFGETCDDGDASGGDGCSADCQDEGCIADTPGYPGVPLCDDGDNCTVDTCNPQTSSCEHSASCDDGIDCTIDTCQGTTCVNTPDDAFCDGINQCAISICSAAAGCVVGTALVGPCDDGLFCNGTDTCDAGQCALHTGSPCAGLPECQDGCNEALEVCGSPFGTPCTSDGNLCTDDVCDGGGNCVTIPNSSPCDDGIFCNGSDVCSGGGCSFHAGPPCVLSGDCRDFCDEGAQACQTPAGEECRDDGNSCTDDLCDGSGVCLHVENTGGPCDGDDFCTVGGQCIAGECVSAEEGVTFSSARVLIVVKAGVGDDQFVVKADFTADALAGAPDQDGIRLALRSSSGGASYESFMPAALVAAKGTASSPAFKFKDAKGLVAEANGVRKGIVKHISSKRTVRTKFRMKGAEIAGLLDAPDLSLSLLLGDDPLTGDCVSGKRLACQRKKFKARCGG